MLAWQLLADISLGYGSSKGNLDTALEFIPMKVAQWHMKPKTVDYTGL